MSSASRRCDFKKAAKGVETICKACQTECEKFPKVAECKACGDACKTCAAECAKAA